MNACYIQIIAVTEGTNILRNVKYIKTKKNNFSILKSNHFIVTEENPPHQTKF